MAPLLIEVIGGAAVVVVLLFFGARAKRRLGGGRDVSQWATGQGLSYTRGTDQLFDHLRGSPYRTGVGPGIEHVAIGPWRGTTALVMIFRARVTSSDPVDPQLSVALQLPAAVPELTIEPGRGLGSGLQLGSVEFDRAFAVHGPTPKFAYDVLNPALMRFLLDDQRAHRYRIRFAGTALVLWRGGELTGVDELQTMLEFGDELLRRTSRFVFQSGYQPGPDQISTALGAIPAEALGTATPGTVHARTRVQHRGQTVEQADHVMDSRGVRDWFTVAAVDHPAPWPTMMVTPKQFILKHSRYGQFMQPRYDDQVLTGDAAFDEVFAVGSPRPDFARTVLTPQLRSWLVADPRMRTAELIFITIVLRPGRDNVATETRCGRVEVSGLGTLTDRDRTQELTDLVCDVVERLSPAAYATPPEAPGAV